MGWFLALIGCASWYGLRELDALPSDYPLALPGAVGQITEPATGGQIAVDLVFETEDEARAAWEALQAQVVERGFAKVDEGRVNKRDRVAFEGPRGRVEVSCCPKRADRAVLVFVSWWRPTTP